jgi:hypothetical protein
VTGLDTVPELGDPARRSRRTGAVRWSGPSRRSVLQAGAALGTATGMALLGVFPAARRAYADGYDIYGRCPSYASDHDCSPGCGPSPVFADACLTSGASTGFHKSDGTTWTLRPNQCYAGSYDGWLWRHQGACGSCACHVERRCHDGYRRTSAGWVRSVCRWTTDCGCPGTVSWPTVRRGDSGPDVTSVQHLLNARGAGLAADGVFGPLTETAVRNFQAAMGLSVTGVVDTRTWPTLVITIRRGDSGAAVRAVQVQLVKWGYELAVDGVFGPGTEAAVRDAQLQNRLVVDGVVGSSTWRALTGGAGG